jgi:alpha-L-fucosidase
LVKVSFRTAPLTFSYGDLVEIWFDGGLIPPSDGGPNVVPLLQNLQPNAVVFNAPPDYQQCIRWVGEEDGTAPDPNWSTCNVTECVNGGAGSFGSSNWCPTEADTPLRGNGRHDWFWLPDGEKYIKTLPQLYSEYIQSVGRNANYLLNINPNNVGLIDNSDMQRYIEFGMFLYYND